MGRSAERALLVAAARAFLNEEPPAEALTAVSARSLDWGWILRRAEAERLAPLLYAVFRSLPFPIPILDRLRTGWVSGRRQYLLGVEQISGVLSAFEREGVAAISLKGPALGAILYRDPSLRPFTDLDLLIHETDRPRAVQLLSALGYRHLDEDRPLAFALAYKNAACFVGVERRPDALPIDLHWGLMDSPGLTPAPAIDLQEIWSRAVKVDAWDQPARGLCPEDLLIYLAVHWAIHHALSGFIWQLDLALLLRRFRGALDWDAVTERARRWGVSGALYFALCEIQERLDAHVPPSVLARLRPRGLRRPVLQWLRRRVEESRERLDYLIPYLVLDRASVAVKALAIGAFPPAAWVCSRYAQVSFLRAYLAHYGRIGKVCLRTLRAAFPLTVPLPLTPPSPPLGERIQGERGEDKGEGAT